MQEDRVFKWLLDIQSAILEVEAFIPEGASDFRVLRQNIMFRRALERNIEIIGEAVNRILYIEPGFPITSARRIVDTRNFISHEYEKVSDEILWAIAIRHIPALKAEVDALIMLRTPPDA